MALTLEELKAGMATLSPAELADLQEHLDVLAVANAPDYQHRVNAAMRAMDAGDKVSLMGFIRDHASPETQKLLAE